MNRYLIVRRNAEGVAQMFRDLGHVTDERAQALLAETIATDGRRLGRMKAYWRAYTASIADLEGSTYQLCTYTVQADAAPFLVQA